MAAKIKKVYASDRSLGLGNIYQIEKELDAMTGERRYTYCGMEELYKERKTDVGFSPSTYKIFDNKVLEFLQDYDKPLACIYQKGENHFSECEVIRKNVAMLRLALYNQAFPDGEYNPSNPKHYAAAARIQEMGIAIGASLKHEYRNRLAGNLVTLKGDTPFAERRFGYFGKEHIGAQELYNRLLKKQNRFTWNPLRWLQGKFTSKDWDLPPLAESIFRPQDIDEALMHDAGLKDAGVGRAKEELAADVLWVYEAQQNVAHALSRPKQLPDAEVERSVILAHTILDGLKNMKFGQSDRDMSSIDLRDKHLAEGQRVAELAMVYQDIILDLAAIHPEALAGDRNFAEAQMALGKLGYLTLQKAKEEAYRVGDVDLAHKLLKEEDKIPDAYKATSEKESGKLVEQVGQAIRAAVEYREAKTARKVMAHAGMKLTPEAAALVQKDIGNMKNRIHNTGAYIAGVSTSKANWAIHAAEAVNNEKQIAAEQRRLLNNPEVAKQQATVNPDAGRHEQNVKERNQYAPKTATVLS